MSSSEPSQDQPAPLLGPGPQAGDPPQTVYQYAPPQYLPPVSGPRPSQPGDPVNVLGVIALVLLLLQALSSLFTQLILHRLFESGLPMEAYNIVAIGGFVVLLIATGLAIGGVSQKRATRYRWTAVGALVSAGLSIVAMLSGFIGSSMMALFY